MVQSFLPSLAGFSRRVCDDAILNPIMVQDFALVVVVSVLASSWVRWCCTHFATSLPLTLGGGWFRLEVTSGEGFLTRGC